MKAKFRKSTSFILALAMIIGMLPAIAGPAAEAAAGDTLVYDMTTYNPLIASMVAEREAQGMDTGTAQCIGLDIKIANGSNWEINQSKTSARAISNNPRIQGGGMDVPTRHDYPNLALDIYVPEAGRYSIASFAGYNQGTQGVKIFINDEQIGTVDFTLKSEPATSYPAELNYTPYDDGVVELETGVNTLMLSLDPNKPNDNVYPGKITLVKLPDEPVSTLVYDMTTYNSKIMEMIEEKAQGEITEAAQRIGLDIKIANGFNWEINQSKTSAGAISNNPRIQGAGMAVPTRHDYPNLALDIYVPEAGYYSIASFEGYPIGTQGVRIYMNDEQIGTVDFSSNAEAVGGVWKLNYTPYDDGVVELVAGVNTLMLSLDPNKPNDDVYPGKITLKKEAAPVEIENANIFGDVSAYITKTENGVTFTALSGINSTEYSEVGFYINGTKVPVAGNNVYKSVKITSTTEETITEENFFESTDPADAYVFFSSAIVEAGSTVEFYPYAVPVEGAEITGHTYTVSLS